MKIVYFLIIFSLFSACLSLEAEKKKSPGFNTASDYSHLCEESDLYGLWKVMRWIPYFEVKGKMWETPPFMKNQWFEFDGKGGMKSLATNIEMKLDVVKRKLSEAPSLLKLSFNKKGFLNLSAKKKEIPPQTWRCSVIDQNIKIKEMNIELKKGDVIMTHLGDDNNILYFRQMRRVEEEK